MIAYLSDDIPSMFHVLRFSPLIMVLVILMMDMFYIVRVFSCFLVTLPFFVLSSLPLLHFRLKRAGISLILRVLMLSSTFALSIFLSTTPLSYLLVLFLPTHFFFPIFFFF